jgi:heme-degrading monooxygenase HmoA
LSLRLVNVVGTRAARAGEDTQLVHWYTDHVHQLMAFPGLLGATLLRRSGDDARAPPYLCLYDFADRDAFEAYEHGPVHAGAARDRQGSWGRDGIEIVLRAQFERLYRGASAAPGTTAASSQVHALRAPASREHELAARAVERAAASHALLRAATPAAAAVADYLLVEHAPCDITACDDFETVWRSSYELVRDWSR